MQRVVIIGAEIAGLSAAYSASSRGAKVSVFERKKDIGVPLTGGEIFACVPGYDIQIPEGAIHSPEKAIFHGRGGYTTIKLPKNSLWQTNRMVLVKTLAERAERQGPEIILGEKMTIRKAKGNADVVIDASGFQSMSYKEYGIGEIKEKALAIFYNIEADFSELGRDLHFWWLKHKTGYAWIYPKDEHIANVGIGWRYDGTSPSFNDLDSFLL